MEEKDCYKGRPKEMVCSKYPAEVVWRLQLELELECARVEVLARACEVLKDVKSGGDRG